MYNLEKDKDNYFLLGNIIKTYGYKGELIIHLLTGKPEEFADLKVLFINIEQSLVPWFVESIDIIDDRAQLKVEDINNPEEARLFVGKEVYLPRGKKKRTADKAQHFMEFIGFTAIDEDHGAIGMVEDILERPEQKLIRIMKDKKEVLIPLSEEMIIKIDSSKRELHLKTPPGLIDLYL